jgi:hypothetical protein
MPFIDKITTLSFNKETFWSAGGFLVVKNLLLLINFLSLLAGFILIGGGGFITSQSSQDILNLSGSIGISAIVIGLIVTIVSFLGCFGAANEKGIMLKSYFGILILLVILEISVGIAAYAKRDAVSCFSI